jgi:apolipoprotein N-acyltransferase
LFTVPAIFILRKARKEIIVCSFFIVISIGFLIFGNLKYNQFNTLADIKNNFIIRTVSSKISLDRFYSKQDELKIIKELISLSNPEKKEPTVFLWPEGIIPDSYLKDMDMYKELFSNNFGNDDLIIMGLSSVQTKNSENLFFNSMAVFNNKLDLIQSYNKVNLVPFGEFTPFEKVLSLVGIKTVTNDYQSFSRGENLKALLIKNDKIELKLLPLICYEIIYSNRLFKDKNFDYVINISEDGWFGNSIGPKQHFAHSIFRSIESGKYVIRSANNGISAIINPIGIIEKKVEFGSTGYIDFKESKVLKSTLYMNYGDKIFFILILLYIFLIFSFKKITHE